MATIVDHLSNATECLYFAQIDLELAAKHAISRRYAPAWTNAINKALTDAEAVSRHLTNIIKCLPSRSDPPK